MGVAGNIESRRGSGICDLYNKISDWFDECRNEKKVLIEQEYLDLVIANIPPNSHILDLGCGSAVPISRFFIEQGNIITGIDGAESMIAKSQKRFPEMNWILGDMRKCDLAKAFDAIIAWDSFFHLNHDDQRDMFSVFQRHAKDGCVLVFTSGPSHGEAINPMLNCPVQDDFYHASLDSGEYRELLEKYGFEIVLHKVEDEYCGGHTVWIARYKR